MNFKFTNNYTKFTFINKETMNKSINFIIIPNTNLKKILIYHILKLFFIVLNIFKNFIYQI